jgi:hypothetical protein
MKKLAICGGSGRGNRVSSNGRRGDDDEERDWITANSAHEKEARRPQFELCYTILTPT